MSNYGPKQLKKVHAALLEREVPLASAQVGGHTSMIAGLRDHLAGNGLLHGVRQEPSVCCGEHCLCMVNFIMMNSGSETTRSKSAHVFTSQLTDFWGGD